MSVLKIADLTRSFGSLIVTNRVNLTPVAIHEAICFVETVFRDNPTRPDHEVIPKPRARSAMLVRICSWLGLEIAHPLFCTTNSTGADSTAARFIASETSPSLVAPSPR